MLVEMTQLRLSTLDFHLPFCIVKLIFLGDNIKSQVRDLDQWFLMGEIQSTLYMSQGALIFIHKFL